MKILNINECELDCDCGWNILIGGTDKEELEKIKDLVKKNHIKEKH